MNAAGLPDALLKRIRPEDRRQLGVMTQGEAEGKYIARSEKQIHKQIISLLQLRGIAFDHQRMDKPSTGTPGWPDFTFALHGVPVGVEVKFGTSKPEEHQFRCHAMMRKNGWIVYVVWSFDEFRNVLNNLEA